MERLLKGDELKKKEQKFNSNKEFDKNFEEETLKKNDRRNCFFSPIQCHLPILTLNRTLKTNPQQQYNYKQEPEIKFLLNIDQKNKSIIQFLNQLNNKTND